MIGSLLLTAHVIVSLLLIVIVLVQRSEGGIGALGGGGGDALMGGASAGNVMTRMTRNLFILFIALSLGLSIHFAGAGQTVSVVDEVEVPLAPTTSVPVEVPGTE